MNNQDYFKKNQKMLLSFLNTEGGRHLLNIKESYPIIKVTENSFHQLIGFRDNKPIIQARFYTYPRIAEILLPIFEKRDIALQYTEIVAFRRILENPYESFLHFASLEEKNWKYPQIYLDVSTFTPNSGGTGQIRNTQIDTTAWADVINAASGTAADPSTAPYVDNTKDAGNFTCARGYTPFDTSSLTADATITAGVNTLGLYFTSRTDNNSLSVSIFSSTQASNTTLATSDFSLVGTTQFITAVTYASLTLNAVNTLTLNSSGDSNISKTGFSKFSYKSSGDYNNSAPTLVNALQFTGSGANAPVLTVTYTLDTGGVSILS